MKNFIFLCSTEMVDILCNTFICNSAHKQMKLPLSEYTILYRNYKNIFEDN